MSEEKRFRSGFTGMPNALYLANLNDRDALYAFLRFEGDTFFGGLKSATAYCQILRMGHRRVANLLEIWQREMAQPDLNRISTGSGADVSPATADSCGDAGGQMAGKWREKMAGKMGGNVRYETYKLDFEFRFVLVRT